MERSASRSTKGGGPPAALPSRLGVEDDLSNQHKTSRAALARAVSLHLEGKLGAALKELKEALNVNKAGPGAAIRAGAGSSMSFTNAAAAASYAKLLELRPDHRIAHFNQARCAWPSKLESMDGVAAGFEKSLRADPSRSEAHLGLGTCLLHLDRPNEACRAFDDYLAKHPDHEDALLGRGVSLQKMRRLDEAKNIYLKILAKHPRSEECLITPTEISLSEKDHDRVRQYGEMLLNVNPDAHQAYEALATAAFAGSDFAGAIKNCEGLLVVRAGSFRELVQPGRGASEARQFPQGGRRLRAGRAHPARVVAEAHPRSRNRAAEIRRSAGGPRFLRTGQPRAGSEAAWRSLEYRTGASSSRAIRSRPRNFTDAAFEETSIYLPKRVVPVGIPAALCAAISGAAAEAFKTCLKKRNDWPEAQLNAGIASWKSGDLLAAAKAFQAVMAARPHNRRELRGLAALTLEQGNYKVALQFHQELIDLGQRGAEAYYNAGNICQKMG